jgi:hypothetical protein
MAVASLKRSTLKLLAKYNSMLAGNVAVVSDYELISTALIANSTTTTVTFDLSSFASMYKHVQIKSTLRTLSATTESDAYAIRFNSDSGANYSWHFMGYTGTAGSVASAAATAQTYAWGMPIPGANFTSGAWGVYATDILDAFSSVKNKTLRTLCAYVGNSPRIYLNSVAWFSTAPVTSITITTNTGANFASGSRISIYGLRG